MWKCKVMSKLISYINENYDIGDEYYQIFGKSLPSGKFFCPFHDNKNTPSAKRYGNVIHCFGACGRSFSVYDLLKRFNPNRIEEIKSSTLISVSPQSQKSNFMQIKHIDRDKSIDDIIRDILL